MRCKLWAVSRMRWPAFVAAAVFVAAVMLAGRRIAADNGAWIYALDDAYIHMAMAKNVATHGVWGCTPYEFASASSSPLWTVLLSVAYKGAGVRDSAPLVLNLVFGVAALVICDRFLARAGLPSALRVIGLTGLVIVGSFTSLTLMGMEHLPHEMWTIWFAAMAAESLIDERASGAALLQLSLLAPLLASSRYEGVFLVAIVAASFAVRGRVAAGALIGATAALPLVLYGLFAIAHGGWLLPNSLMIKAAGTDASPLSTLLKPPGAEDVAFYRNNPVLMWMLVAAVAAAAIQALRARTVWVRQVLWPFWLALAIVLHGHFVFSSTYWAYRYDAYLLGFGIVAAAIVVHSWGRRSTRVRTVLPKALAVIAVMFLTTDVRAALSAPAEVRSAVNTRVEHLGMARFIESFYDRDIVVVNDVGAVSYYTNARLLDVVGLCSNEPVRITRQRGTYSADDLYTWTATAGASIAIMQIDWAWVAPRVPWQWIKVAEVTIPTHGQRVGFFAIDSSAASRLRANVQQFYGGHQAGDGYRLRLY